MVSTKQRTIAISTLTIVAVLVLFASAPVVATHQASGWGAGGGGWGANNMTNATHANGAIVNKTMGSVKSGFYS